MPRLLFFAPRLFAEGDISGAALTIRLLRRALAVAGHPSTLLIARGEDDDADGLLRETTKDGLTVRSDDPVGALVPLAREQDVDAVVLPTAVEVHRAIEGCRAVGMPVVMYFRNCTMTDYQTNFAPWPEVLYMAPSRFGVERLRAWSGITAHESPPIIVAPAAEDGPHDRVLFVNPIPAKGGEIVFAIARELSAVPFMIVESWLLHDDWRRFCLARIAPFGNIDWRTAATDMDPIWRHARLLLMPSIAEEAWGRVASEAQAAAVPVVASRRGALPEVVGTGGVLIDIHAPIAQWCGAIERIFTDRAHREQLGAAARQHAARPALRPQCIVARFIELVTAHAARVRSAA